MIPVVPSIPRPQPAGLARAGGGGGPSACDAMFCTNTEICNPACLSLCPFTAASFWGMEGGFETLVGGFTTAGGGAFYSGGRRFAAALSGLKPQSREGGRAAAPGAPRG